ncbi:MAG: isochorismatase family protein [Planctomycetaceae bacterium]|nr:isochorismatase family protein [Planctomycetaceae bacterium]
MSDYLRSHELIQPTQSLMIVIDLQEKLLAAIPDAESFTNDVCRLLKVADVLDVPMLATEQYPQGLGATVSPVCEYLDSPVEKKRFSSVEALNLPGAGERQDGRFRAVLVGIEAHVCVLQTAFDLQAIGYEVVIPVDAVRSQKNLDYETAIRRLENSGMTLTTIESLIFEWCGTAAHPEFKKISRIVTGRE